MKRYIKGLCLPLAVISLLLTGCFFRSVDELYAVPEAPEEYWALQNEIKKVRDAGGEYIAPLTGEYIQSVQLQDLDGDGVDEAIAFFQVSGDERPLKIYIYRQIVGGYLLSCTVEGTGTAINAIAYEQLNDTPTMELVVSWQMSDKLQSLAAYSIDGAESEELLRTDYTAYQICDLDMDNQKEIAVIQTGTENSGVTLYNLMDGVLGLESYASLSQGANGLVDGGIVAGYLQGNIPALFIPSNYGDGDMGVVTDIFAWVDGSIKNITLDGVDSEGTIHWYNGSAFASDINGDNITELPLSAPMLDPNSTGSPVNFWYIRWRQYDITGAATSVFQTYHNEQDGWYFILPEEWEGKISLERQDSSDGGERGVVFSYWGDQSDTPQPFLTIYRLSGTNRQSRASLSGRFSLVPGASDEDTVLYVAKLTDIGWDCGLDEAGVIAQFNEIKSSW